MTKRGIRRLIILATALAVVAATLVGAYVIRGANRAARIEAARELGLALHASGDFEGALPSLALVVSRDQTDPAVLAAYAECRRTVPLPNGVHYRRAIHAAKTAVDLSPSDQGYMRILLDLYIETGYLTEYVGLSGRMLDADPTLYGVRLGRVEALLALDRNSEALAEAEELIAQHPDRVESYMTRDLVMYVSSIEADERVALAREVEPRFAQNPDYYAWLSSLERLAGNLGESVAMARRAAGMPPTSGEQVMKLVDWLRRLHGLGGAGEAGSSPTLLELADDLFARAMQDEQMGREVAAQATRRAWWANQTERAYEFAGRVRELGAEDGDAPWARLVLMGERPGAGGELVDPGLPEAGPDPDWEAVLAGMDALRRGESEDAARRMSGVELGSPEARAVASYIEGVALQRIGDHRGAVNALRRAAESPGIDRDRAWKALGDSLAAMGRFEEADASYASMSSQASVPALRLIDNALRYADRYADPISAREVLGIIREEAEEAPDDPMVQVRLARAMVLAGEAEEGKSLAERLIGSDPAPDPRGMLGLIQTLQTYAPELSQELLAAVTQRTDSIELIASQAGLLARAGRLDEGRAMLEQEIGERDTRAALPYRRALVRVLDEFNAPDATGQAVGLSDDYPSSAAAQLTSLSTRALWDDLPSAVVAVSRLREATGEGSGAWRTYDARARLASEPSDEDLSQVIIGLGEVLRENPDDFDALVLVARAYREIAMRKRDADETGADEAADQASSYFERAAGNGVRAAAFRPYIEMLLSLDRHDMADRILERYASAGELTPSQIASRREVMIGAGRWSDAASDHAMLATLNDPRSALLLAQLYTRAGKNTLAADVIERLLDHRAWEPGVVAQCGVILCDAGAINRAIAVLRTLPETSEAGRREQVIADNLARVGETELAYDYQIALARETGGLDDWLNTLRIASAAGDPSLAEAALAEALAQHPDAPELAAFTSGGHLQKIALAIATSLPADGDTAPLRDRLIAFGRSEIGTADLVATLEAFTARDPSLIPAWRLLIEIALAGGDREAAARLAHEAADANPGSVTAQEQLVRLYYTLGDLDTASAEAARLVELARPNALEAELLLGAIEMDRGNSDRVVDLLAGYRNRFERESQTTPSRGLIILASAYAGLGNAPESFSLLARGVESGGDAWQEALLAASVRLPQENTGARRRWAGLIDSERYSAQKANMLLAVARVTGDGEDAEAVLELANAFGDPSQPGWAWVIAQATELTGDTTQAETLYRRLVQIVPDQPGPALALADLLAGTSERARESVDILDQLTERLSSDPPLLDRLQEDIARIRAESLLSRGEADEAYRALSGYEERASADPRTLVYLAKIHLELANKTKAQTLLERVHTPDGLDHQTRSLYTLLQGSTD